MSFAMNILGIFALLKKSRMKGQNMTAANVKSREGDIFMVIREIESKTKPASSGSMAKRQEALPDPIKLRESLLAKRDIFRKLESGGYIDSSDLTDKVDKALKVLEDIINTTS